MRNNHAAGSLAAALALACGTASAQTPPTPSGPPENYQKPQAPVLQKQQLGTGAFAIVARSRMRSGDCADALDVFDQAIMHSIDASLRRDRGICHEQLGHAYAAIDDYRAYLTDEPDAPDAEGIRVRLGRLEQSTTGRSSTGDDDDVPPATAGGATATVTVGTGTGADAQGQVIVGGKPRDAMDYVEHDNDEMRSPLRRGKGFSLAPILSVHKWFFQNSSFGDSNTWAEAIGLQFRYSVGHVSTFFIEAAYQQFNSNSGSNSSSAQVSVQGLTSQIGWELRLPLDEEYDNQLFLAPGIGFDHLVESVNVAGAPSISIGAIVPRVRFGYRYLVAPSAGIDFSLDGGVGKFATYSNPSDFPFGGSGQDNVMLAFNIALLWGL